jgi:hypothetical protein
MHFMFPVYSRLMLPSPTSESDEKMPPFSTTFTSTSVTPSDTVKDKVYLHSHLFIVVYQVRSPYFS